MPTLKIAAFTHRGRVRTFNEDAIAIGQRVLAGDMDQPLALTMSDSDCFLMISDGMGGHAHGALASRTILDRLIADTDRLTEPATCTEAIRDANDHLYQLMQSQPEASGMGATLVGAVLTPSKLLTFNIGDSRAYLLARGHLVQLSHDDVPRSEANRSGHRRSHAITQALGGTAFPVPIHPHVNTDAPLAPGETLLICSDGLTDMAGDHAIRDLLNKTADPAMTVRDLTACAFRAGGRDNISLIVARLAETSQPEN